MTLDEAKIVARVCGTADNACSSCVHDLVGELNRAFPAFVWSTDGEYSDDLGSYCIQIDVAIAIEAATAGETA